MCRHEVSKCQSVDFFTFFCLGRHLKMVSFLSLALSTAFPGKPAGSRGHHEWHPTVCSARQA